MDAPLMMRPSKMIDTSIVRVHQRAATRYDKLAANYLAFIQLASIRLWLRVYEP
jgi:transposase